MDRLTDSAFGERSVIGSLPVLGNPWSGAYSICVLSGGGPHVGRRRIRKAAVAASSGLQSCQHQCLGQWQRNARAVCLGVPRTAKTVYGTSPSPCLVTFCGRLPGTG